MMDPLKLLRARLSLEISDDASVYTVHNVASDYECSVVMTKVCLNIIALLIWAPIRPGWTRSRVPNVQCNVTLQQGVSFLTTNGPGLAMPRSYLARIRQFTGTITIPRHLWDTGSPEVLTINGKFVEKYPPVTNGTSLRDVFRNRAPEGARKSFWK